MANSGSKAELDKDGISLADPDKVDLDKDGIPLRDIRPGEANGAAVVQMLEGFTGFWFSGGDQSRLSTLLVCIPIWLDLVTSYGTQLLAPLSRLPWSHDLSGILESRFF